MPRFLPVLMAMTLPAAALASGAGEKAHGGTAYLAQAQFTYALFEETVDHVDLADCPAEFDPDAVFCRMTLASEQAHVFAFSLDGDQPLLAVKSYALDEGFLPF